MARMKLKQLEMELSSVEEFAQPKILLEQYPTRAPLAAAVLHCAQSSFGDLEGKTVADLGVGCGVLTIGAVMMGADWVTGIDVDPDALEQCQENLAEFDLLEDGCVDLVLQDVPSLSGDDMTRFHKRFDTVITNPPFGTKHNKGIDMAFVKAGLALARTAVYSMHKSSTRDHVVKKAKDWGVQAKVLAQLRFDLPASYKHHKKASVDVEVDLVRFSFDRPRD